MPEKIGGDEVLPGQLVLGGSHLVHVRLAQRAPRDLLGPFSCSDREVDIAFAREPFGKRRVLPQIESDHFLAGSRHMLFPSEKYRKALSARAS